MLMMRAYTRHTPQPSILPHTPNRQQPPPPIIHQPPTTHHRKQPPPSSTAHHNPPRQGGKAFNYIFDNFAKTVELAKPVAELAQAQKWPVKSYVFVSSGKGGWSLCIRRECMYLCVRGGVGCRPN